jgi:threonine dehydrogenase-like Zn-dependent dehydrogenase
LRLKGIDDVVAFDLSAFRRERALALGARVALDPRERPPADVLKEMHGTDLYSGVIPVAATDVYFEASGAPQVLPEIIEYARANSDIVIVAIHKKPVLLDIEMMVAKEISLLTAVGYPTEMPDVVAMLDVAAPDLKPLVSHRFAAEDFLRAFDTACNPEGSAKVLIQYS